MPNTQNDMKQFCKQTNYNNLNNLIGQMESANINLFLPVFRYECTSRAEKALGKLGLTTLFTSKADLSAISPEAKDYQIEELVQHVAIRFDEGSSGTSSLSGECWCLQLLHKNT
jgi:serine protease inhibitor